MPSKINLYQIGVWFCVGFSAVQAGRSRRRSSGRFYLPSKRGRGSWDCCGNAVSLATCINRRLESCAWASLA